MAPQPIAVVKNNVVTEIIIRRGQKIIRDCDRLVDITERPDIVVGTKWPFGPKPVPAPIEPDANRGE